jgi:hypothetical protein
MFLTIQENLKRINYTFYGKSIFTFKHSDVYFNKHLTEITSILLSIVCIFDIPDDYIIIKNELKTNILKINELIRDYNKCSSYIKNTTITTNKKNSSNVTIISNNKEIIENDTFNLIKNKIETVIKEITCIFEYKYTNYVVNEINLYINKINVSLNLKKEVSIEILNKVSLNYKNCKLNNIIIKSYSEEIENYLNSKIKLMKETILSSKNEINIVMNLYNSIFLNISNEYNLIEKKYYNLLTANYIIDKNNLEIKFCKDIINVCQLYKKDLNQFNKK